MKKLPSKILILLTLTIFVMAGTSVAEAQINYTQNYSPTLTTGSNPTPAVTNSTVPSGTCTSTDNTVYCPLAPLPGIGDPTNGGKIDVARGFSAYLDSIIKLVMGLIGVFAVFMIVVGGIEYMSTVSIGEKEGARNRIMNAILGLLLALGSYIILNTINPSLVSFTVTVPAAQAH